MSIRLRSWILPGLGLGLVLVLAACSTGPAADPASPAGAPRTVSLAEAEAWAQKTLGTLSLERKIGQMICAEMRGEFIAEDDPRYQSWLSLARDHGVGAFVLYGGTPQDTAALLNRLQKAADLPLLISSDFEGGPGQQIVGATEFPANMALSAIGSEDLAYQVGKAGAAEGRAVGIHITYSPVVDIQTRPDNPVLGVRSFGADMDLLGRMAGAYIRGYQENGMLATAKHYPGRGEVELIAGTEYTINRKPADRVEAEDFLAFKKAIDAGVAYIMSEHIAIPSVTEGSDLPASVEKRLATDWLRGRLGFQGILTTDDMWYEKVVQRFGAVEACVLAVEAGHDAVLKPADPVATIRGLVEAVKSGRIPEARIDSSVKKILTWKARLDLPRNRFVDESHVASVVGRQSHKALLQKIADESLTLVKNDGFFPSTADKLGSIVHVTIQRREVDPVPALVDAKIKAAFPKTRTFFLGPTTAKERYAEAVKAAQAADTVVISLFHPRTAYKDNGPLKPADLEFLNRIIAAKPKTTIAVAYGNPYLAAGLKNAAAFAVGYGEGGFFGNQIVYADSFIRLLKGEIKPAGKLPVNVSVDFPVGTGVRY
ncbi:MAG: glycoside hydrolase family 3 N-terminal domain-containing protein [Candidatus Aminicenantes bacterium]|nr:glycoside hydrolase family 3 N-terminal domain-containing protein [Candidatus Aminicenantes bacterium]